MQLAGALMAGNVAGVAQKRQIESEVKS